MEWLLNWGRAEVTRRRHGKCPSVSKCKSPEVYSLGQGSRKGILEKRTSVTQMKSVACFSRALQKRVNSSLLPKKSDNLVPRWLGRT